MHEPSWVKIASDSAVITRDELLDWLKFNRAELRAMMDRQQFPAPRFTGNGLGNKVTARSRWRVGDVRAWLDGRRSVEAELKMPAGFAPDSKNGENHVWRKQ